MTGKGKDYNSRYPLFILILLILPILFLSACVALKGGPTQPATVNAGIAQQEKDYFTPRVIVKYNCLGGNKDLSQSFCEKDDKSCEDYNLRIEKLTNCKKDIDKQKIYRNQVINERLSIIDHYFGEFIKNIQGERSLVNIASDFAVLGLGVGTIISSSKQLKDIFAAISTGITGARLSLDKNLYFEKTIPALVSKMDALRKAQLVIIRTKMQLGTDKYDLTDALLDITGYVRAGTILGAIQGITDSASEQRNQANKDLKQLVVPYKPDDSSKVIDAFWRPVGTSNDKNEKEILKWQKDNKIEYVPIQVFIVGEPYKELRQKAVVDLKLPRQ
jgi:hypothetical protein